MAGLDDPDMMPSLGDQDQLHLHSCHDDDGGLYVCVCVCE